MTDCRALSSSIVKFPQGSILKWFSTLAMILWPGQSACNLLNCSFTLTGWLMNEYQRQGKVYFCNLDVTSFLCPRIMGSYPPQAQRVTYQMVTNATHICGVCLHWNLRQLLHRAYTHSDHSFPSAILTVAH